MAVQTSLLLSIVVGDDQGSSSLTKTVSTTLPNNTLPNLTYSGVLNEYLQAYTIGVAAPTNLTAGTPSTTGGTLAANTYFWVVTGLNGTGETVGGNEVTATTTGSTSSVPLVWNNMAGATTYRIYRGTSSAGENHYQTSTTNSFTDTGATGTSASPPGSNTTGTSWTPTLSMTPLQFVYVRNMPTSAGNLTVTWTPTGGSSASIVVLSPGGEINFLETGVVSSGGISALSFSTSAQGTTIEGMWTA